MAKSILQEIATLNAKSFNAAELKVNLYELELSTDRNLEESRASIQNNEATLSIKLNTLQSEIADEVEELKVQSVKTQVDVDNLKSFAFSELANNYHVIGTLTKDYKRNDQFIRDQIDNERLQYLSYFTGPIYTPVIDSVSGFKTGYSGANTLAERPWVYIVDDNASYNYLNGTMLSLDAPKTSIVLGDSNLYQKVYCTGDLTVQTDFEVKNGVAKITSSSNTENSLTINGNFVSTAGKSTVKIGYITDSGGYKATSGDFDTASGGLECTLDIHSTSGSLEIDSGHVNASTGVHTTSVGFSADTGSITTGDGIIKTTVGNIETANGSISCTAGYHTDATGYFATIGNFETQNGYLKVTGDIDSSSGHCFVDSGFQTKNGGLNITTEGAIYTKKGDITTDDGNLVVKGSGTFDKKLIVKDDGADLLGGPVVIGATDDAQNLTVYGNIELHGEITYGDAATTGTQNHTANGNLTVTDVLTVDGNLDVTGVLTVTDETNLTGYLTSKGGANLKGANTLGSSTGSQTINGTRLDINCDVDAGGYEMTADKFNGVATSAYYGDVAENYLSDLDYAPGTLLSLGGDKEVTLYDPDLPLAGIVSTNPGLELNDKTSFGDGFKDHGYIFIALSGRVPVKTKQFISKGDYIFPDDDDLGYVIGINKKQLKQLSLDKRMDLVGVALSNSIEDEFCNEVEVKV